MKSRFLLIVLFAQLSIALTSLCDTPLCLHKIRIFLTGFCSDFCAFTPEDKVPTMFRINLKADFYSPDYSRLYGGCFSVLESSLGGKADREYCFLFYLCGVVQETNVNS